VRGKGRLLRATSAAGLGTAIHGMGPNVAGALTYPMGLITGLFFLSRYPYNRDPFVRFHAFQSIFLSAFYILFFMAWGGIFETFAVDLRLIWRLIVPVWFLLRLALFPLSLFFDVQSFQEPVLLAAVYRASRRQNWRAKRHPRDMGGRVLGRGFVDG